jgi:cell division control protein 45
MLIDLKNIKACYEAIAADAFKGGITLSVFVSASDSDSVCALRILISLFKGDNIQYSVNAVFSFGDLMDKLNKEKDSEDLKNIIILGCGANLDLSTMWFTDEARETKCFIFDSHRPFHHKNVH